MRSFILIALLAAVVSAQYGDYDLGGDYDDYSSPSSSYGSPKSSYGSSSPYGSPKRYSGPTKSSYGKAPTKSSYGKAPTKSSYGRAPTKSSYGKAPSKSSYGGYGDDDDYRPSYGKAPTKSSYGKAPSKKTSYGKAPTKSSYGKKAAPKKAAKKSSKKAPKKAAKKAGKNDAHRLRTPVKGYGDDDDHHDGGHKSDYDYGKPAYGTTGGHDHDNDHDHDHDHDNDHDHDHDNDHHDYGKPAYGTAAAPDNAHTGYGKPAGRSPAHNLRDDDYCEEDYGSAYGPAGGEVLSASNSRGTCGTLGQMVCSGTGFNTCDYSHDAADLTGATAPGSVLKYVYRDCAPGTACRPFNSAILCDWPNAQ